MVELAIEEPAWGQVRMANELKKRGMVISRLEYAVFGCATISRTSKND